MKGCPKNQTLRGLVLTAILGLQGLAGDAFAQAARAVDPAENTLVKDQVRSEINDTERRWYGLTRIRWHDVQTVSAGLGAIFVTQPRHADCTTGCAIKGWLFEVEPGLNGVQAGLGWGKLVGETGRNGRLLHTVHFGWNVRGVVLRTWGNNALYPQSQTLAGIEAGISIIRMNISVSVMRSLYSGPGEQFTQDWVISMGYGWGF